MRKDLVLVAVVMATLTLMVLPLSQGIIDVLLAANMSLAVLLLMVALYLRNPSDFSTFPSVILIGTAFRLALSIGTTRLILSDADGGQIIETFGEFVVAGSIAIGLVIFLIITVVQFLVVTKGAERVAEVGARFALDAMPGKQMAIDAEMRAGTIDADEAAVRRRKLDRDSQFFGAMDGAMKFVKGDAIAGLIIICINLLGGIAVGMTVHGMSFGNAVGVYSLLTVGDGLVAQIPALLMSLCAGVIVTRVTNLENDDLGTDIFGELVSDPRVPSIASIVVLAMGFIPGFPLPVFASISALLLITAMMLRSRLKREASVTVENVEVEPVDKPNEVTQIPVSTRLTLAIGVELADSIDLDELQRRIETKFDRLHAARGVLFPKTSLMVDPHLAPRQVTAELDEVPIFTSTVPADAQILCGGSDVLTVLKQAGVDAPSQLEWLDLVGYWAPDFALSAVRDLGYRQPSLEGALAHLAFRIYERNLGLLFSSDVFGALLAQMMAVEPKLMAEIDEKIERPALHRLLKYLVEDGVPVRPLPVLIGGMHYALHSLERPKVVMLAEHMRTTMKRQLCYRIAGEDGVLGVMLMDPALEENMRRSIQETGRAQSALDDSLTLPSAVNDAVLAQLRDLLAKRRADGARIPVMVCAADLRRRFRNYLAQHEVHIPVLATHELSAEVTTYPLDLLRAPAVADMKPIKATPKPVGKSRKRPARRTKLTPAQ